MATNKMPILEFIKISPQKEESDSEELEPEARSGHRIIVDENHNIYSIGGYNPDFWDVDNDEESIYPLFRELWKFNTTTRNWTLLKTHGYMPTELASHSAMRHGPNLLVFGGTGVPFGEASSNDLHVCNLKTLEWKRMDCSGRLPIRAYGHSMAIRGDFLYIFGGTTGWEYNSEVHRLSLVTFNWDFLEVDSQQEPPGRYRHEVAIDDKRMYIIGGGRSYIAYGFQQISGFELKENRWNEYACHGDTEHGYPPPRRCHSCVQLEDDVYMLGGYDGTEIYGDIWKLNLKTYKWTKLAAQMPKPSYFHSAAITSTGCLYVYGGVVCIDHVRTSDVYKIWLKIPSLKDLCWDKVISSTPQLASMARERMQELGIPLEYMDRLKA